MEEIMDKKNFCAECTKKLEFLAPCPKDCIILRAKKKEREKKKK
jgi:Na+-translocating ferredoxin:NAD+ oxidoreductase RNF subunit RnfB